MSYVHLCLGRVGIREAIWQHTLVRNAEERQEIMSLRPSEATSQKDKTQREKGMGIKCLIADTPIRSLLLALYRGFLFYFLLKGSIRTSKAAKPTKVLAAQPASLSSTPGPTWWKENLQVLL